MRDHFPKREGVWDRLGNWCSLARDASQARVCPIAEGALRRASLAQGRLQAVRAARPDSLDFARDRLLAAQKPLARDDNRTAPLPKVVILPGACGCGFVCSDFGTTSENPSGLELFCYLGGVSGL